MKKKLSNIKIFLFNGAMISTLALTTCATHTITRDPGNPLLMLMDDQDPVLLPTGWRPTSEPLILIQPQAAPSDDDLAELFSSIADDLDEDVYFIAKGDYTKRQLDAIKVSFSRQSTEACAAKIHQLSIEKAAQIMSYKPILIESGKIWHCLGEEKATQIWNMIEAQSQKLSPSLWDSSYLKGQYDWEVATVEHFRHWIKNNPANIAQFVNTHNINNFLMALIGRLDIKNLSLNDKGLSFIPHIMKQLPQLNCLKLDNNPLANLPANAFANLTILTHLSRLLHRMRDCKFLRSTKVSCAISRS